MKRMDDGALLADDIVAALDQRLAQPAAADAALLERVRQRVLRSLNNESALDHVTVRASDQGWETLAPGLLRKVLHEADGAISTLMRLAPGVVVPGHSHGIDEECMVLEGTLRIGPELLLHAGDFHVGRKGMAHGDASTDTGALVYLRGAKEAPVAAV